MSPSSSSHQKNASAVSKVAPKYYDDLKAPIDEKVSETGPLAPVHRAEWQKLMKGEPVRIHPTKCEGMKVMDVREWSALWKPSERFNVCLACKSTNTKEHCFIQSWCGGCKIWDAESICLDCHKFSYRSYRDPDFKLPHDRIKEKDLEQFAKLQIKA